MEAMTIAEAAGATGFSASALRFYENAGLIAPGRTPAGYRAYTDDDLSTLRFIGRAKRLGLSLEEIAELVPLLDAERCAPVQDQLRAFVHDKIAETRRRTADLVGFLGQLERMAAWLGGHTPDGACDDRCGCTTDPAVTGAGVGERAAEDGWVGATLVPASEARGGVAIACTLGPDDMDDRIAAWQAVTATARSRQEIDGGVRVRLPRDADVAAVARLMAAEQACCSFFSFALTVTADAVHLDATAPDDGRPFVDALLGAPS